MKLLEIFRRKRPIRDPRALADFIDAQAAFLVQKGIYEYSRARAGHYAKVLFAEPIFAESVERSRWQAFPLGLAMVAEMVEGALLPQAGDDFRAVIDELAALVLSVFDRYPLPAALDAETWRAARAELSQRLLANHGRKAVKDIPIPYAERYFALMPIHEKLRGSDFPAIRNYLRVTLCNMHAELTERMDADALVGELVAARV
jgi:hypothetical protein